MNNRQLKEPFLMAAVAKAAQFRGVLCRHCGKPVRVPGIVLRKDSESHVHHDANDVRHHLVSRVFVLRCRSCERESIYAINQIVDCPPPPTSAERGLEHATL
jgi:hypothetical protein